MRVSMAAAMLVIVATFAAPATLGFAPAVCASASPTWGGSPTVSDTIFGPFQNLVFPGPCVVSAPPGLGTTFTSRAEPCPPLAFPDPGPVGRYCGPILSPGDSIDCTVSPAADVGGLVVGFDLSPFDGIITPAEDAVQQSPGGEMDPKVFAWNQASLDARLILYPVFVTAPFLSIGCS